MNDETRICEFDLGSRDGLYDEILCLIGSVMR